MTRTKMIVKLLLVALVFWAIGSVIGNIISILWFNASMLPE